MDTGKVVGAYMDRTLKILKQNYLQVFKKLAIDITTEQWVIIDTLAERNGLSQAELATNSFKNAPTVSRIIDLLCKKGLTERQRFENDRRRHRIFLTNKGKEIHEKILPEVVELREQGWENLSETDYDHLVRILDQVFVNYQEGK